MLAEVKSFDAVVKKPQVVVVSSHVADEVEEPPLRLAAVVGEEEGAVGGDSVPCLADGAGHGDGFRRQQEENLGEDLFREVGDVEGTPPQLWRPRGLRHCHRAGAGCTKQQRMIRIMILQLLPRPEMHQNLRVKREENYKIGFQTNMRFNENPSEDEECTGIEAHLILEVTILFL